MLTHLPSRLALVGLAAMLAPPAGGREVQPGSEATVFQGATIVDGTGRTAIERGVLIVRNGKIEAVGPAGPTKPPDGAEMIDLSGKTIVPGLVNAHGHVGDTKGLDTDPAFYTREHVLDQLRLYARYGVTTVFSLGGDRLPGLQVRDEQSTPSLTRARLFVAGDVVTATDPAQARVAVDDLARLKVDIVKIRVDDNLGTGRKMPEAVYRAIIDQAHQRGLRVAAHIFYLEDAKSLLRAGVDFIAHSVRDQEVDEELIDLFKSRDVCYCPTLMREVSTFVYETTPTFFDDPFFRREIDPQVIAKLEDPARQATVRQSRGARAYKQALEVATRNLKALADAGVRIAMGTDTGPPGRFQGYFEHLELERMVEAGLTPAQAIIAATGEAARCMNAREIGTLQRGNWADLVVLDGNPLSDIRKTRTIASVWIAGNRVTRATGE